MSNEYLARCEGTKDDYLGCIAQFGDTPATAIANTIESVL